MSSPGPRVDLTLIPLRLFLGVTFVYAGVQKLADPAYLRASAPSSVQAQLAAAQRTSPIGGALSVVAHNAVLFGLLIALGELAVGAATLLGLWTRVAAAGGMALALSFLLTVSWHTSPYYLGADIVFLMAFTPLLIAGPHPWSLDALADRRSRADAGLAVPRPVPVELDRLRRLCGLNTNGECWAQSDGHCDASGCPVLDESRRRQVERAVDLPRRRFLETARMAGGLALVGLVGGAATAAVGRMLDVGGGGGAGAASTPGALSKAASGAGSRSGRFDAAHDGFARLHPREAAGPTDRRVAGRAARLGRHVRRSRHRRSRRGHPPERPDVRRLRHRVSAPGLHRRVRLRRR